MPYSPLPEPLIPDANRTLANYGAGYAIGQDQRQQNALSQAGEALASGDQTGARNALYQSGQVDAGLKLEDHFRQTARQATQDQLEKAQRFNDVLGNLVLSVKSKPADQQPAAWNTAIDMAAKSGLDVEKYRDPATMDFLLAQSKKTSDWLNMEAERRKTEADQALKGDAIDAKIAAAAKPKPKSLSFNDTQKLADKGVQLENVTRYGDTFKDESAGYGRGGETAMWLARNLPILTGPTTENSANWWQDYDRYKNKVRNELFGSALTAGEQEAFDKADINPNMDPKLIRENLARQKKAAESALAKTAKSLTSSGYSQDAVEGAIGVPMDQIGGAETPPDQSSAPSQYPDAKQAPDGHWYVQKSGKFFRVDQ